MTHEQYNKIFNETLSTIDKKYSDEEFQKLLTPYLDSDKSLSVSDLAIFCFNESYRKSVRFLHELLKNFIELEEEG